MAKKPIAFQVEEDCTIQFMDLRLYRMGHPDPSKTLWFMIEDEEGRIIGHTRRIDYASIPLTTTSIRFVLVEPVAMDAGRTYKLVPCPPMEPVFVVPVDKEE